MVGCYVVGAAEGVGRAVQPHVFEGTDVGARGVRGVPEAVEVGGGWGCSRDLGSVVEGGGDAGDESGAGG